MLSQKLRIGVYSRGRVSSGAVWIGEHAEGNKERW
jgi:hypothetical protein